MNSMPVLTHGKNNILKWSCLTWMTKEETIVSTFRLQGFTAGLAT